MQLSITEQEIYSASPMRWSIFPSPIKSPRNHKHCTNPTAFCCRGSALFPMRWQCCGKKTSFRFCGRWQRKSLFLASALGMQVLFCQGEEFCLTKGLGLLKGQVKKMNPPGLKIPHMGWNRLEIVRDCPLTRGLPEQAYVYFVHSYQAVPQEKDLVAWAEYGGPVPALVWDGAYCYGAQFHPEKSGETGLRILQNFADLCRNTVRINP